MVITKHMKNSVNHKKCNFIIEVSGMFGSLPLCDRGTHKYITQQCRYVIVVGVRTRGPTRERTRAL
jgi:hypothetical protein